MRSFFSSCTDTDCMGSVVCCDIASGKLGGVGGNLEGGPGVVGSNQVDTVSSMRACADG